MLELTQEQRRAAHEQAPVRLIDPETQEAYVLVKAAVFERIQALVADDAWDAYPAALEAFAASGWDDPRMDAYDALDPPAYAMNVQRRDIVLVDFPYPSGAASKVRPALVIQNDADNARLLNTILAQITGTTRRALEATQILIDVGTPEGKQTGLLFESVVNCVNVVTVDKKKVLRRLGQLPDSLIQQVNNALKVALEIP